MYISAIGQDSHRFEDIDSKKRLILAGVEIVNERALAGNSDADVVLHAVTNAISGLTGVNILGKIADDLCLADGITDSRIYLEKAMQLLGRITLNHISISIECKTPKITPHIENMKNSLSKLLGLKVSNIGITATTGEGLTDFGRGLGISVFTIISAEKK